MIKMANTYWDMGKRGRNEQERVFSKGVACYRRTN